MGGPGIVMGLDRNETTAASPRSSGGLVKALLVALGGLLGCASDPPPRTGSPAPVEAEAPGPKIPSGFEETAFGGEGCASIDENRIVLEPGVPLAGVTWTGAPPAPPYVLEVEFTKRFGNDFPCAVTFPVAGSHLTLVLGGWGGTVCGLSSLDGLDASRNETRFLRSFAPGVRTHVRLDVGDDAVRAALDGVEVLRVELAGRTLGLRGELWPSRPLGIAAYATSVELHSVRWGPPARGEVGSERPSTSQQ